MRTIERTERPKSGRVKLGVSPRVTEGEVVVKTFSWIVDGQKSTKTELDRIASRLEYRWDGLHGRSKKDELRSRMGNPFLHLY